MRRSYSVLLFAFASLALVACKNPASDVPAAQVNEPAAEGEEAAAEGEEAAAEGEEAAAEGEEAAAEGDEASDGPNELALNPENTKVTFIGSKVTASHSGGWNTVSGSITWTGDVAASTVALNLDMGTLYSDNDRLTGHLHSDEFFDVANHPAATFTSTGIAAGGEPDTFTVTGDLQIKDQTHSVSFPALIKRGNGTLSATAEFSINRQTWGISYPGMQDDLIRDEVVIAFNIEAAL